MRAALRSYLRIAPLQFAHTDRPRMAPVDSHRTRALVNYLNDVVASFKREEFENFNPRQPREIARELGESTRGQCPMVELTPEHTGDRIRIRALANRAGLLRLGARLAEAALDTEVGLVVHPDGWVEASPGIGLIEITLTDAPWPQRRIDRRATLGTLGACLISAGIVVAIAALTLIGLVHVATWIIHRFV